MEPVTFFGIVLVATAGAMLANSHSNSKKIKDIQDKLFKKKDNQEEKVIAEGKEKEIEEKEIERLVGVDK